VRLGLVGYGNGGRHFHAPYIVAARGVELVGVVTRSSERRAELALDYPGMPAYDSLDDLIAAGVDAVTITTPPETRRELVLAAVDAGVHVIADKPFAPTADAGRELAKAARAAGVALSVYQNRRWDPDIRTLAGVIERGELGEVWRVESRFDLDEPGGLLTGPHGGMLRDVGVHLIDQMRWLLGPVRTAYAQLDWVERAEGRVDVGFVVSLIHAGGARSHLSATKINRNAEKELRAYGSDGAYIAHPTDAQARAIFAGRRPTLDDDAWGYEPEAGLGTLRTSGGAVLVPSVRGAYQDFYAQFAAALAGAGELPVPAEEAILTLEVLDAARTSDAEGRVVSLGGA
jgi:predicted dehydrogenase